MTLRSYNEQIEREVTNMSEYNGAHNYVSSLEMRLSPDRRDKEAVNNETTPMPFGEGIDYGSKTSADRKLNIYVQHN